MSFPGIMDTLFGGEHTPPVINSRTFSSTNATSVSHITTLPALTVGRKFILVMTNANAAVTTTMPAGWTRVTPSASLFIHVWERVVDGTEGASVTVTSSTAQKSDQAIYEVSNYSGTAEVGTEATGTNTTPDPPAVTPSWGADSAMVLALYCNNTATAPASAPSGYSNLSSVNAGGAQPGLGMADKTITASSEDPGTFSATGATVWYSQTIAIRGA